MDPASDSLKRKRSPSESTGAGAAHNNGGSSTNGPPSKAAKTSNQLSINYLARHFADDLPLINKDDTLPNLLNLISSYNNILDRHESLASNLGARPLGPILIKRFERCFDAPPKIVAAHSKGGMGPPDDSSHSITWLEVIEFARSHPAQFTLSSFSEGSRVCQFYSPQKQLRVQVSEEDFLFINSGRCQELIPPLPIWEDEEKEFNTCDLLEIKLKELTNAADMVAARTRQLSHRLKGRKAAIQERRAEGGSGTPAKANAPQTTTAPPSASGATHDLSHASGARASSDNREQGIGASSAVRNELLRHFESLPLNNGSNRSQSVAHSRHQSNAGLGEPFQHSPRDSNSHNHSDRIAASSMSPAPSSALAAEGHLRSMHGDSSSSLSRLNQHQAPQQQARPPSSTGNHKSSSHNSSSTLSRHNFSRPLPPALESSQPFRLLCQAYMDSLPKGTRVIPPCDRCRRLRIDCLKNLTSCAGCTRKHARCHWRDVMRDELAPIGHLMDTVYTAQEVPGLTDLMNSSRFANRRAPRDSNTNGSRQHQNVDSDDDDGNPLEDLEALGQKEDQESRLAAEQARRASTTAERPGLKSMSPSQRSSDKNDDYGREAPYSPPRRPEGPSAATPDSTFTTPEQPVSRPSKERERHTTNGTSGSGEEGGVSTSEKSTLQHERNPTKRESMNGGVSINGTGYAGANGTDPSDPVKERFPLPRSIESDTKPQSNGVESGRGDAGYGGSSAYDHSSNTHSSHGGFRPVNDDRSNGNLPR